MAECTPAFIRSVLCKRLAVGIIAEVFDRRISPRWLEEVLEMGASREQVEQVANALIVELTNG